MTYTPTAWVDYGVPCINAANLNNMEAGIDRAQGDVMVLRGLTAARPASDATLIGRIYFATDTPYEISRDNGAGWDVVGYTNDLFAALGTLQVGSGVGAAAPLGIGAPGQVLTVAAGTAAWAAPAGGAWQLIAETVLVGSAASVTFAAIPGTYRTLVVLTETRTDSAAERDTINIRFNGDTGNNYDEAHLLWYQASVTSATNLAQAAITFAGLTEAATSRANTYGHGIYWIDNYASATAEKRLHGESACMGDLSTQTDVRFEQVYGGWRNVATITSVTFFPLNGPNFVAGSSFTLYGIT